MKSKKIIGLLSVFAILTVLVVILGGGSGTIESSVKGNVKVKYQLTTATTNLHLLNQSEIKLDIEYKFYEGTTEITENLSKEEKTSLIEQHLDIQSSNEEIVYLKGNVITAGIAGEASITIRSKEQEDIIDILVGEEAQDFELSEQMSVSLSDQYRVVKAVIIPYAGVGELKYDVVNPEIADVDESGKITPKQQGVTMVEVTLYNAKGEQVAKKAIEVQVEK